VPSCWPCNNGASDDDEYFRTTITLRHGAYEHPVARRALEKAVRGLARPERRRLLQELKASMRPATLTTPSGVIIDEGGDSLTVDGNRILSVIGRISTGLFRVETGTPLPTDCVVKAAMLDSLLEADPKNILPSLQLMTRTTTLRRVAGGAFMYRFLHEPKDPDKTICWMSFYDDAQFVGFTLRGTEHARRALASATSRALGLEPWYGSRKVGERAPRMTDDPVGKVSEAASEIAKTVRPPVELATSLVERLLGPGAMSSPAGRALLLPIAALLVTGTALAAAKGNFYGYIKATIDNVQDAPVEITRAGIQDTSSQSMAGKVFANLSPEQSAGTWKQATVRYDCGILTKAKGIVAVESLQAAVGVGRRTFRDAE
jgi:hypothetical protein